MLKFLKILFYRKIQIKIKGFKLSVSIVDPLKEIESQLLETKDLICNLKTRLKDIENNVKKEKGNNDPESLLQNLSHTESQLQEFENLRIHVISRLKETRNSLAMYSRHKPLSLKSLFLSFSRIIPKKHREEYVGELLENRAILKKRGLPKWWINVITFFRFLVFLRISHWEWLQDLVTSVFESIKELIQ